MNWNVEFESNTAATTLVNRHELGKAKDQCWDNDEVIMYTHLLINVKTEFQHEMRTIHSAAMWIVTTSALGKN